MITIPANHKYATLALRISHHLQLNFTEPLELGDGLWATAEMPVAVPDNWQQWLGSIRIDRLHDANFFLFSQRPTAEPQVLDHDNQHVIDSVQRLYFALLMAAPYIGHEDDLLMSGARYNDTVDVRRVVHYEAVLAPPGVHGESVMDPTLRLAKDIFNALTHIYGGDEHSRVRRMVRAFHSALRSNQFGDRIHQLLRCVEGFVFPDEGRTRNQMCSRTELFLGPRHHMLMRTLFDIRSAVEHLHGPYRIVTDPDPQDAALRLAELSWKAEALARYCLRRLFTTPGLWPHFTDDTALGTFWTMPPEQRTALWGAPMQVATEFARFDQANAALRMFN